MHLVKQRQLIFCAYPYIFYHFTVFRILYSCEKWHLYSQWFLLNKLSKRNIFVFVRWQISILSCNNDFFYKIYIINKMLKKEWRENHYDIWFEMITSNTKAHILSLHSLWRQLYEKHLSKTMIRRSIMMHN